MTVSYRCIGKGVTNANGVAKLTHDCQGNQLATEGYTGTGAGELDIVASTDSPSNIGSGSLVSETYSIHDCLFADRGDGTLNSNWGWYNTTGGSASITSSGISISNSGSVFGVFYADDPNKSGRYDWETPHCVEFDVVSSSDYSKVYIYYYDGTYQGFINSFSNFSISNGSHVKIVNTGTTVELFVDGVSKQSATRSMTPDWIGIRVNSGGDLVFKNFEIYLI